MRSTTETILCYIMVLAIAVGVYHLAANVLPAKIAAVFAQVEREVR